MYDVDGIDQSLIERVRELAKAGQASVVLPDLSGVAGFAAMNAPRFLQLVDSLDDHDRLLEDRITLTVTEPQQGEDLLQPGYLVCFDGEPPEGARLQNDTRVHTSDGPCDGTYAVLQVEREHHQTREQEISQKAAKLVAELNGKGQSDTKSALDFLTETLRAYDNYQRIERARELARLTDPTRPQQTLLDELRSDEELRVCFEDLPAE